ncbi:hypothetical protein D3C73_485770 [compost metagenome]
MDAFKDHIYYCEEKEVLVLGRQEGAILHLFDIMGNEPIDFEHLASKMIRPGTEKIWFYFTPDLLKVEAKPVTSSNLDTLFIRSTNLPLNQPFKYPVTSQA